MAAGVYSYTPPLRPPINTITTACCVIQVQSFAGEMTTNIPYTGNKPTVSVAYLQPDGTLLTQGVFTQINITATEVIVDHGGLSTGYIKLLTDV